MFTAVVENAITNVNGVIEYEHETKEYDSSLKNKFTDLSEVKETVEVKSGSVETLDIQVKMPSEEFDGIILGGIRVSEVIPDGNTSGISNVFSYVIPVKIRQNDTVIPNKLNFLGVSIGQQTYENVIKAKLQNPQPEILRELTIEAKIFEKNGEKALYEEKREDMKLAPNSNFPYTISLGKDEFEAGEYRLELTAKAEDLDEKWTEDFEITAKKAQELNEGMVFKEGDTGPDWKLYLLIGALVIAAGVIGYLLYRQQKLKVEAQKMTQMKKKKRKKVKKSIEKLIIFMIAGAGLFLPVVRASAEETNHNLSEATIRIFSSTDSTGTSSTSSDSSSTTDSSLPATNGGKSTTNSSGKLPQTGESNAPLYLLGSTLLMLSGAIILIKAKKKEVGK